MGTKGASSSVDADLVSNLCLLVMLDLAVQHFTAAYIAYGVGSKAHVQGSAALQALYLLLLDSQKVQALCLLLSDSQSTSVNRGLHRIACLCLQHAGVRLAVSHGFIQAPCLYRRRLLS